MKVIIIGGVAGGASCAARLRRLNENAEIIIYEKTNYISYANCGLPYYIGDVIKEESSLTLSTPSSFKKRFNIDVFVNHEVLKIDSLKKQVIVKDLINNTEFVNSYDKLVIATGAKAIKPNFYLEDERVFTLKTVEDAIKIKEYIKNNTVNNAAIIGGGFIGLEMSENLKSLGLDVALIEGKDHVLNNLDFDIASFVHNNLIKNDIKLYLNTFVDKLIRVNNKIQVIFQDKSIKEFDIIVCSIGVRPESLLGKDIGLELGINNLIKVNEHMETSINDIYAVGDVVEVKNFITCDNSQISLAGPANKQGRIAADNICGIKSTYKGSLASSIIKVFDLSVATTGINEETCKRLNINYEKVIFTSSSHANYYPGGKSLTSKIIYNKDNLDILGGQIIGYDSVDKRIDVLATAIFSKLKATNLKDLDLSYAPPYSTAKDPINMAGFIIENIEQNLVKQFYYEDINNLRKEDVILLDTRTKTEYERGHAEGFMHIPLDELRNRLTELDKSKPIYVMCQSGLRSYIATRILCQSGFNAYNFAGGYLLYSSVEKSKCLTKEIYNCGMDRNIK